MESSSTNVRVPLQDWICPLTCRCGRNERQECPLFQSAAVEHPGGHGHLAFDHLPAAKTAEVYGVQYAVVERPGDGQLLVTRYGWPWLEALRPEVWYAGGKVWRDGQRLGQSTGTVYRMRSSMDDGRPFDLVVKVSRCAQDVPLFVEESFRRKEMPEDSRIAVRFNNPLEEFGRIEQLRRSHRGPRILTKRPLAIYCPPEHHPLWQLGRAESAFALERASVARGQSDPARTPIDLHAQRDYFVLFGWIRGYDVSTLAQAGAVSPEEMERVTAETLRDLQAHGMTVLDHKPAHIIVRTDPRTGQLRRRRNGRLLYALVDYELLVDLPK